jgi:protein-S-isoprenylcysteine O-methyltransferase Ste14
MKSSYLLKHLFGSLIFFSLIFISAGRIIYWQGLAYLFIGMVMVLMNYTVLAIDPELQKERSKPGANTKNWDKAILGLSFLSTLAMYITAGLDSGRFHWSPDFHISLYVTGGILTAAGQLIFLVAQKQNKFFSSTVRIQTDRNHTVCDTGLYKVVRHPAYMGSLIQAIGFPLIFGSLWSIIPVAILIILHFVRTYLEDKTLKEELSGYSEYARQTPYRIIPLVW